MPSKVQVPALGGDPSTVVMQEQFLDTSVSSAQVLPSWFSWNRFRAVDSRSLMPGSHRFCDFVCLFFLGHLPLSQHFVGMD